MTETRSSGADVCVLTAVIALLLTIARQEEEPFPYGSQTSMTLFVISIPFMILAVMLAVLPLVVMSVAEHHRTVEAPARDMDMRANGAELEDREVPQAA